MTQCLSGSRQLVSFIKRTARSAEHCMNPLLLHLKLCANPTTFSYHKIVYPCNWPGKARWSAGFTVIYQLAWQVAKVYQLAWKVVKHGPCHLPLSMLTTHERLLLSFLSQVVPFSHHVVLLGDIWLIVLRFESILVPLAFWKGQRIFVSRPWPGPGPVVNSHWHMRMAASICMANSLKITLPISWHFHLQPLVPEVCPNAAFKIQKFMILPTNFSDPCFQQPRGYGSGPFQSQALRWF